MIVQQRCATNRCATSPRRDKPWIFRTYAGHSTAAASNALYRNNLSKGQTGLSVAFDLPTQTGYDSDHPLAKGEVGKVGVPISHIGDMRALFEGIPLGEMNTSMTINATAAWLLALYVALADEQGVPRATLQGTTQNDIIKEYLSRGTYVFPPAPSMRLTKDVILFTTKEMPKWNPMNVCSYHLQEAGATPVQELAFALATAIGVLDAVKASGQCAPEEFGEVVGRISFFVNAGLRFVTEICKMRAFTELWDEITRERYGVTDAKQRLFRYGVQVNSLGLTEQQPENNVARILIEMLAVTLSKDARARAVQLPAWNEALGLPRPWDQQWSLRMQQILAYETDLLEYGDVFDGSPVIAAKVAELKARGEGRARADRGDGRHGRRRRARLSQAAARRIQFAPRRGDRARRADRRRRQPLRRNRAVAARGSGRSGRHRVGRRPRPIRSRGWMPGAPRAMRRRSPRRSMGCARRRASGANIMPASIACAKAGVTTGEWGFALRAAFGEYRAPTGVGTAMRNDAEGLDDIRAEVDRVSKKLGRRLKFLVGKPGLDGHSNGAEQIAARARDAGMEVVYDGIRLTAEAIAAAAAEKRVHVVGLSILSGSHLPLVHDVMARMKDGRPRRRAGRGRRHHPAAGRERSEKRRRRRGLHAEGFRAEPHHGRSGADRGSAAEANSASVNETHPLKACSTWHHRRNRLAERARTDRLAQIGVHAGRARRLLRRRLRCGRKCRRSACGRRRRRARGCAASLRGRRCRAASRPSAPRRSRAPPPRPLPRPSRRNRRDGRAR